MEYSVLFSKLRKKGYEPQVFGREDASRDLLFARLWDPAQTVFDPAALYLGSASRLPDPELPSEFTFFCYGEWADFSRYDSSAFTVAYFGPSVSEAALFNDCLENLSQLQEIDALKARLADPHDALGRQPQFPVCPTCGAAVRESDVFCRECGGKL